jgi:hypothetical protein
MSSTTSVSNGQWYHIQVCRSGSTFFLFVNGNLEDTYTSSVAITTSANVAFHLAGAPGGSGAEWSNSYIDDVLVLKGFALNTSSFTPPTSPLTTTVSQTRNDLAVLYLPFDDGLEDKARNHSVTANGNAAISATQAQFGGKSLFIDATGDYLAVESTGNFNFGSNDFTISMFIRPDSVNTSANNGSYATILDHDASTNTNGAWFTLHQKNQTLIWARSSAELVTTSDCLSAATWHHVAIIKSSNTTSIVVDGTTVGSASDTNNYSDTVSRSLFIGKQNISNTRRYDGYIDDLLIVKGFGMVFTSAPSAASDGEVTDVATDSRTFSSVWNLNSAVVAENFKAGTWPVTFDNRISLYLPFDVDIQDDSSNSHTVTAYGSAAVSTAQVKYGAKSLDLSSNTNSGGVATDYLTIPDHSSFDFGSGDFTVTAWVNLDSNAGNKTSSVVLNKSISGASSNSSFYFGAGKNGCSIYTSTSGTAWNGTTLESSTSITPGNWVHIAWVRNGNVFKIFQDGTETASTTNTITIYTSTRNVDIGRQSTSGSAFKGYIDDLRVIKGHAEYTSNFTPPTSAAGGVI